MHGIFSPAFRTDPARQSTSRDGWKNVRQTRPTCRRQPTSRCTTSGSSNCMPSEVRSGSRTVIRITTASTMPGAPLIIHAQRQPWKHIQHKSQYDKVVFKCALKWLIARLIYCKKNSKSNEKNWKQKNYSPVHSLYDTIWNAILACAQKLTSRLNLPHTTKN